MFNVGDKVNVVQTIPGGSVWTREKNLTITEINSRYYTLSNGDKYIVRGCHIRGARSERGLGCSMAPRIVASK